MRRHVKRIWTLALAVYAAAGVMVWNCDSLRQTKFSLENAKKQAEENQRKIAARKASAAGRDRKKDEVIPPKEITKIGKNLARKKTRQIARRIQEVDETLEKITDRLTELRKEYDKLRGAEDEMFKRIAAIARTMARFSPPNRHIHKISQCAGGLTELPPQDGTPDRETLLKEMDDHNRAYADKDLPQVRPAVIRGRMAWLNREMARLLAAALKRDYAAAKDFPSVPAGTATVPESDHPEDWEEYLRQKDAELDNKYAAMKALEEALRDGEIIDDKIDTEYLDRFAADDTAAAEEEEKQLAATDPAALRQAEEDARRAAQQAQRDAKAAQRALNEKQRQQTAAAKRLTDLEERLNAASSPISKKNLENSLARARETAAKTERAAANAAVENAAAAHAAGQAQNAADAARRAARTGDLPQARQFAMLAAQAAEEAGNAAQAAKNGQTRGADPLRQLAADAAAQAEASSAQAQAAAQQAATDAQPLNEGSRHAAEQARNAADKARNAAAAAKNAAQNGDTSAAAQAAMQARNAAAQAAAAAEKSAGPQLPRDRNGLRDFSGRYNELGNTAATLAAKAASMARQAGMGASQNNGDAVAGQAVAASLAHAGRLAQTVREQSRNASGIQVDLSRMMRMAMGNGGTGNGEGGSGFESGDQRFTGDIVGANPVKRSRIISGLNDRTIISNSIPGRRIYQNAKRKGWVFVDSWYVIGPWDATRIPSSRLPAQAPEKRIDLDGEYYGKLDPKTRQPIKLRWRYVQTDTICVRPPDKMNDAYYYAYTDVWFAKGMDMNIILGSDDAGKVWINGMVVWDDEGLSAWKLCEGVAKVYFKPGWNKILIRIHNGPNECQFSFALAPPLKTR